MWLDKAHDFRIIESIFGREPSLENVCLHSVLMNDDGASIAFRFDLNDFPDNPPKKWIQAGFNTAQITLSVWGLNRILISEWGVNNIGDINITYREKGVQLFFKSEDTIFCEGAFLRVENVSGYLNQA